MYLILYLFVKIIKNNLYHYYKDIVKNKKDVFLESDVDIGPAMQDHLEVASKDMAYKQAKEIVDMGVFNSWVMLLIKSVFISESCFWR